MPDSTGAWIFEGAIKLNGYPVMGQMATYGGGGYAINLGTTGDEARKVVKDLFENKWIDRRTRAIFVEFLVYNANANLWSVSNLILEHFEGGGTCLLFTY